MLKGKLIQQGEMYSICPICHGEGKQWLCGVPYDCKYCYATGKVIQVVSFYSEEP